MSIMTPKQNKTTEADLVPNFSKNIFKNHMEIGFHQLSKI